MIAPNNSNKANKLQGKTIKPAREFFFCSLRAARVARYKTVRV